MNETDKLKETATRALIASRGGRPSEVAELFDLLYESLHDLAAAHLAHERAGHTLQPTALIHEAYVRLVRSEDLSWKDRTHFFAIAATCIRQILIEYRRRRSTGKRGGQALRVTLSEDLSTGTNDWQPELLDLEQALAELEERDGRQARVVELRFFGGLSVDDCAQTLSVSPKTVKNDWRFARAWLFARLNPELQR